MDPINKPTNNQDTNKESTNLKEARSQLRKFWDDLMDLRHGVDKQATIAEIKDRKSMSGANGWMLMCSIMIASLGLNLDSQAVIIGAMLISPLMSPILGIGLAVGINDQDALKKAATHFGIAIAIAILTSTLYFWLSPLDTITEQIVARTKPTFLDILIAFFGGLAGIISVARKDISTTLPGVAIATALMPPLCVTGFGIANGEWQEALSSFYLFFLNSFFVALATYLIVRYMRFPYKVYVNKKERFKNMNYIIFFTLIMIIPSFVIFKQVLNEVRTEVRIQKFLTDYIGDDLIYLDQREVLVLEEGKKLILKVYGNQINKDSLSYYQNGLESSGVKNMDIEIITTSDIRLEHLDQLQNKISGVEKIATQLEVAAQERLIHTTTIKELQGNLDGLRMDSTTFNNVSAELKLLFPDIEAINYANTQGTNFIEKQHDLPVLIIDWPRMKSLKQRNLDNLKIQQFVQARIKLDTLKIMNE
jgi:uncharacterized hydrophobic protein (TIGR00271 family)